MKRPYYCPKVFYKHFAYLSLFLLFSISCSDDLFEPADLPVTTKGAVGDLGSAGSVTRSDSTLNGDIVLGAVIPNPYTLDTVRKAFTKVFPNDGVSGYTLAQIEGAVSNTKNLEELRGKVKAIRNNSAENVKIDTLINKVKYYWDKYKN